MYKRKLLIALICLITLLVTTDAVNAQEKITGPWLWMIAPTELGSDKTDRINNDSLAPASGWTITETDVAKNGANEGDRVGTYVWTLGEIFPVGSNNINECINRIGLSNDTNIDLHTSYALITLESATAQPSVVMRVGSDDAIKVWLNGEVVHTNPINRGATDFQDEFLVNLRAGRNLLMVKVLDSGSDWSMFVGINANITVGSKRFSSQPTEMVQLIYFLPHDRQPKRDIGTQLDTFIKEAQQFYAEQMENHGFGRKTFRIETDSTGNAVVHHFEGKFNEAYYHQDAWEKVWEEIAEQFHSANIYLIVMDVDVGVGTFCGAGVAHGFNNGRVLIPLNNPCFNLRTLTHELGHAFYLNHDFRDDAYRMSYGENSDRLSQCAAEWLDAHRYFNDSRVASNTPTTVELLPSTSQSSDGIQRHFKITDPDGLHQAQLLTPETLLDCKRLNGTEHTIVFDTTQLKKKPGNEVWLRVIDVQGNIAHKTFQDYTNFDNPIDKITGPWLWMIAPTMPGQGGAASIDIDSLALASQGAVTEVDIASNGAHEKDSIGNYQWTLGEISPVGPNNINGCINRIGLSSNPNIDDHSSYALITLESTTAQPGVVMRVGSDDAIKVWLNGEVVYTNPINRGASDFQDEFNVDLKKGDNLLLVKVSDWIVDWSMFVGIDADVRAVYKRPSDPVATVDVNGDGLLNVLDLVLIAVNFGKTGQNPADVNGDGVVNIVDLVKVAGEMGAAAAAPSAHPQTLEILSAADVRHWLTQAQHLDLTDATSQRGMLMLEQLLAALIPKEVSLLPNYPNPFNPETWIPYELADASAVRISIYDVRGHLVRDLELGHQTEGYYTHRSRAAYWDGRNEVGERVSSGIYFYRLQTDDSSHVRKMVILK